MTTETIKVRVNGEHVEVPKGFTVMQACEKAGVEVPSFCYHPKLSIAGNCRMCLVEIKGGPPKPVASCAMPAGDGMDIVTTSEMVKKARKGVLEFLLINHPLDCPICDQGGECDLQDLTVAYGPGASAFEENKRAVPDKYFGPLIKTIMTRCIHCTRCIRFANEIAGVQEIGAFGRGEHMEISTYLEEAVTSELSGNLVDICPVGALTAKPYAFEGRAWEFAHTESIDVLDAVGSHIRVDTRGAKIMRIVPRVNESINETWISDKTRFSADGLALQRLDRPYMRDGDTFVPVTWTEAFDYIHANIKGKKEETVAAIAGDLADMEALLLLKELMAGLGSKNVDCRRAHEYLPVQHRSHYLFNTTIEGIEQADCCLLIGTNPRHEATMINARLRKAYLAGTLNDIALMGPENALTYPYMPLGNDLSVLTEILEGKHPFTKKLAKAKQPLLIIGQAVMQHKNAPEIMAVLQEIAEKYGVLADDWCGYNVLHTEASRVGALDLKFYPQSPNTNAVVDLLAKGKISVLYNFGADDLADDLLKETFVIYQGHHGDRGAQQADVILPGTAYTEKTATYVNTEGRVQSTLQALSPPGQAKEDWCIMRALADHLKIELPYQSLEEVRAALKKLGSAYKNYGLCQPSSWSKLKTKSKPLSGEGFVLPVQQYYLSNVVSRHSPTMAACVQAFTKKEKSTDTNVRTGTDG